MPDSSHGSFPVAVTFVRHNPGKRHGHEGTGKESVGYRQRSDRVSRRRMQCVWPVQAFAFRSGDRTWFRWLISSPPGVWLPTQQPAPGGPSCSRGTPAKCPFGVEFSQGMVLSATNEVFDAGRLVFCPASIGIRLVGQATGVPHKSVGLQYCVESSY